MPTANASLLPSFLVGRAESRGPMGLGHFGVARAGASPARTGTPAATTAEHAGHLASCPLTNSPAASLMPSSARPPSPISTADTRPAKRKRRALSCNECIRRKTRVSFRRAHPAATLPTQDPDRFMLTARSRCFQCSALGTVPCEACVKRGRPGDCVWEGVSEKDIRPAAGVPATDPIALRSALSYPLPSLIPVANLPERRRQLIGCS